jgi:leucyl-tRNA synthetase
MLQVEEVEVVIQVNGKVRGRILVPAGLSEEELLEEARQNEKVRPYLEGKELIKAITVPGKLVNIVVR